MRALGNEMIRLTRKLALSFGQYTSQGVLVAYRLGGQDWQFSNVTANATYQFIGPTTTGLNLTNAGDAKSFELRGRHVRDAQKQPH